jgi:protein O-mannosyl-transferase
LTTLREITQRSQFFNMIAIAGIFIGVILLFLPVWSFDYINFDDDLYIYQNHRVQAGLSWTGIKWAFSTTLGGHWHPLTWLSLMFDQDLFGNGTPGWQHGENVIIHAFSGLLFYVLLIQWGINLPIALLCSLIFSLHPLRIESIAWVSQRKDCISTFFFLLTLCSYTYWLKKSAKIGFIVALASIILGLAAKPTLISTPLLLILLHRWPLKAYRLSWLHLIPFFIVSFLTAVITWFGQVGAGAVKGIGTIPLDERIANSSIHYTGYLGKIILPTTTGIFYPLQSYPPGLAVSAWLLLGLISYLIFYSSREYLIVGWMWFMLSLAPVCGIIQVGGQSITDRWSYISHLGLLIGLAGVCSTKGARLRSRLIIITLFSWLVCCVLVTRIELPNWKNSETVFKHSIKNNSNNFMAHNNLGVYYDSVGKLEDAHYHYQEAVRLAPYYPIAYNNFGSSLARLGRTNEALDAFKNSLRVAPNIANTHYNYGLLLFQIGSLCQALDHWRQALILDPNNSSSTKSLIYALKNSSDIGKCRELSTVARVLRSWQPGNLQLVAIKKEALLSLERTEIRASRYSGTVIEAFLTQQRN